MFENDNLIWYFNYSSADLGDSSNAITCLMKLDNRASNSEITDNTLLAIERFNKINKAFSRLSRHDRSVLIGAFDSSKKPQHGTAMFEEIPEGYLILLTNFCRGASITERLLRFEILCASVRSQFSSEAEKNILASYKYEICKLIEKALTNYLTMEKQYA